MAVGQTPRTLPGAVTPVCGECGVFLCWDVSDADYAADREFWDEWVCAECNGGRPMSLRDWRAKKRTPPTPGPPGRCGGRGTP